MSAPTLQVFLLGQFKVQLGGVQIDPGAFRLRKARDIIKLLALSDGFKLHRDTVIEILWPEVPPSAGLNNLHQALHAARRALGNPAYIVLEENLLKLTNSWVDVRAFERAARETPWTGTLAAFEKALELYNGHMLLEDLYETWLIEQREHLQTIFLQLLLRLGEMYAAQGYYEKAVNAFERLLKEDQLYEAGYTGLMQSLAHLGQRDQAMKVFQRLKEVLEKELQVEPLAESIEIYEVIRSGKIRKREDTEPLLLPIRGTHNLPHRMTRFIGRVREAQVIANLLDEHRLVTLLGTGGIGKSRLALKTAWSLLENYPDGAWVVELESIFNPELTAQVTATALGITIGADKPALEVLQAYLQPRKMLLIMNNCEYILQACRDMVTTLLNTCPNLTVLATSREALHIPGEKTWLVPSLEMPPKDQKITLRQMESFDAIQLFVDRTRQIFPEFELTENNYQSVLSVCKQLDGIPLAIELAAARANVLQVEQIAERLEGGLNILKSNEPRNQPHHQTMHACLTWSYNLLSEPEQVVMQRLSVFVDGWILGAAEVVCSFGDIQAASILDLLEELVTKSLVQVDRKLGLETRFRMLEPVRQFAWEKLGEADEKSILRGKHADYFANKYCLGKFDCLTPKEVREMEYELGNLRTALTYSLNNNLQTAFALVEAYYKVWYHKGLALEILDWTDQLLKSEEDLWKGNARTLDWIETRARMLILKANLCFKFYLFNQVETICNEVIQLAQSLGDGGEYLRARALMYLNVDEALPMLEKVGGLDYYVSALELKADAFYNNGDLEQSRKYYEKASKVYENYCQETYGWGLHRLALHYQLPEEYDFIAESVKESSRLLKRNKNVILLSLVNLFLGLLRWYKGDYASARRIFYDVYTLGTEQQIWVLEYTGLRHLSGLSLAEGKYKEARDGFQHLLKVQLELNFPANDFSNSTLGLAEAYYGTGMYAQAEHYFQEAYECMLDWKSEFQRHAHIGTALFGLGKTAAKKGEIEKARRYYQEALQHGTYRPDHPCLAYTLEGAAVLAVDENPRTSATLLGAVRKAINQVQFHQINYRMEPVFILRTAWDMTLEAVRVNLGKADFEAAYAKGKLMATDEAANFAMKITKVD